MEWTNEAELYPQSVEDLREIKRYIASTLHNPQAAARIAKAILDTYAKPKAYLKMGASIGDKTGFETNLRMLICENQIALYRVDINTEMISIIRITNVRQDYMRILFDSAEMDCPAESQPMEYEQQSDDPELTISL